MKTAVLTALETVEIRERAIPEPGPDEVRLRVGAVGVCGSDVHYYAEGRIGSQVVQYPTLLGHEPAGVVDAVGEGVAGLAPGDRVALEPAAPCGRCPRCLEGRGNICPQVRFLGTPPIEGIFAEYHVAPAHCCIPLPESITLVEAALMEPLGVGLHAVKLARMELGESAAIFGAGPIGLVTLLAARAAGVGTILVTDPIPERRAMAERLGADETLDPTDADVAAWVRERTGGYGADVTFEAAGEAGTLRDTCTAVRIGGRGLIIGIPSVDELPIPMHEMRRRELVLMNVRRSNNESIDAMGLVASKRIDLRPLATHFYTLDQVPEAMETVRQYRDGVVRAIVQPHADLADA